MLPFTPPLRRYQPGLSRSERYSHVWHTAGTQDMPAEQTYLWPSKPGRCHVLKASLCSPPLRPLTSTQPFKVHLGCHHAISPAVPLASLWGSDVSPAENTVGWWGIVEVTLSSGLAVFFFLMLTISILFRLLSHHHCRLMQLQQRPLVGFIEDKANPREVDFKA